MNILDTLTLSVVSKRAENDTPHLALRRKMAAAIDEQIIGAKAELEGRHYSRSTVKVVKHADTGEQERRTVERSLRRWWWKTADGVHLELKFANKPVKIGSNSSIVVGDITNLVTIMETVKQAVVNGELDDALKQASEGRKSEKKVEKVAALGKPTAAKSAK